MLKSIQSQMLMTFSDANIMLGVDANGCLRYMGLETGGLGQRMYYTKVLINPNNTNFRDLPDTSGAVALRENFVDTADYVAGFDSYEEAMHELGYHDDVESSDVEVVGTEVSETEVSTDEVLSEVESGMSEIESNISEVEK